MFWKASDSVNSDENKSDNPDVSMRLETSSTDNSLTNTRKSSVTGRSRGRGRSRRARGRGRPRSSGQGRAKQKQNLEETGELSGQGSQGRMTQTQQNSGRGRSRGRGRRGLVPEESAEARQAAQENQLQELVLNLPHAVLQQLALELLRRQPDIYMDLVNGEIPNQPSQQADSGRPPNQPPQSQQPPNQQCIAEPPPDQSPPDQLPPDQPPPDEPPPDQPNEVPAWCYCDQCRLMPTQTENKCCCKRGMQCMTTMPLFQQIVLDANVLEIQMRYREDLLAWLTPEIMRTFDMLPIGNLFSGSMGNWEDRLKQFGFPIHGCIDGWSRKIIWLYVTHSNNLIAWK